MKIKLNWGSGIFIVYGIFFLFLVAFVFFSSFLMWDLVSPDYYKQEIEYQKKINQIEQAQNIAVKISKKEGYLFINFPKEINRLISAGKIHFYRPSDASKDFHTALQLDENGVQSISHKNLIKGNWLIKINWNIKEVEYYIEKKITI